MADLPKFPKWTWGMLLLPLLFIVWSISIILSVNNLRSDVEVNVRLISKLNRFEVAIERLGAIAANYKQSASADSVESEWRVAYANFLKELSHLENGASEYVDLNAFLVRIRSEMDRTDEIHSALLVLNPEGGRLQEGKVEIQRVMAAAITEVKSVVLEVRAKLATLSDALSSKWSQLNFLAIVSCLLAIILAVYFLLYQRNIIEQEKTKHKLARFRSILHQSGEAIYVTDLRDGKIVDANRTATKQLGYSYEELLKLRFDDVYRPKKYLRKSSWKKRVENVRMSDEATLAEGKQKRKNGEIFPVEVLVSFKEFDNEDYILIVARDISARKQMEEEKAKLEAQLRHSQKMETVGTMAGGIAHDFNNILSAIIGYTDLAMEELPENSASSTSLGEVLKAANHARDIVQQILTFSRKIERERIPIILSGIVQEATKLVRASLPKTIEIREEINLNGEMVLGDATEIHQVLMNLSTNASHAMGKSGGLLEIKLDHFKVNDEFAAASPNLKPGDYLRLTVSDTGCGMDENTVQRIFDPFFTTKSAGEGTGLGLSVVQGIVLGHKGEILVKSKPGKGATFEVFFPLIEGREKPAIKNEPEMPRGVEHILLVDDDKRIVSIGKQCFERFGYQVSAFSDSSEALEAFQKNPDVFDIVITDQVMPDLTGEELAREILLVRPDIKIILMTGFSENMTREKALKMGINEFILKPVHFIQLGFLVKQLLHGTSVEGRRAEELAIS